MIFGTVDFSLIYKKMRVWCKEKLTITIGEQLGSQIRQARVGIGLTTRALGEKIGVTATTVVDYEAGRTIPRAHILARIADVLEIPVIELNGFRLTIMRVEKMTVASPAEQLPLDFTGEFAFSKATIKLAAGRMSITLDATVIATRNGT